jgi:SAM-dependent methyltransferase
MFQNIQYRLLKLIAPFDAKSPEANVESSRSGEEKLRLVLGDGVMESVKDLCVVDFGCGTGAESVALAVAGAKRVIGVDTRESVLSTAEALAQQVGVVDRCEFTTQFEGKADVVVTIDAFEHFAEPAEVLVLLDRILHPGGRVLFSFGPPWLHPRGGHLFSVFPWAHLIFSESALIRWRSDFKDDGATRFGEVEGGLNQMTISRFEAIVEESPLHLERLELVPIRKTHVLHNGLTKEYLTALVRGQLLKRSTNTSR